MPVKIGIPRGMYFYKYYPFTKTFLTELGAEIVPSVETTKEIMDNGVKHCTDDACLPVKVYHGHAHYLRDKADFVLLPRLTSVSKGEYICPNFERLPDLVKKSVPGLPPILDMAVNMVKSRRNLHSALYKLGLQLSKKNIFKIDRAILKAIDAHLTYKGNLLDGHVPSRVIDGLPPLFGETKHRIGIVAHPYLLYDHFINKNLLQKLHDSGIGFMTTDMVDPHIIHERCYELRRRVAWSSGKNMIGSGLYFADLNKIDGILILTTFDCAMDMLAVTLLKRALEGSYRKPFMVVALDGDERQLDQQIERFKVLLRDFSEREMRKRDLI